jgi:hypothetical protein
MAPVTFAVCDDQDLATATPLFLLVKAPDSSAAFVSMRLRRQSSIAYTLALDMDLMTAVIQVNVLFNNFMQNGRSRMHGNWERLYIISTSLTDDLMENREEFVEFIDQK